VLLSHLAEADRCHLELNIHREAHALTAMPPTFPLSVPSADIHPNTPIPTAIPPTFPLALPSVWDYYTKEEKYEMQLAKQ
jgi:hypothetical protein